jgi:hypothetical protein
MRLICQPGSLDSYLQTNQFVHFCRVVNAANPSFTALTVGGGTVLRTVSALTIPAALRNQKIAVYKSGVGGSGNGVAPVGVSNSIPFINFSAVATSFAVNTSLACGTGQAVTTTIGLPAYTRVSCNASWVASGVAIPDAGFSDLEPAPFFVPTLPSGLQARPTNALMFGVPVTVNLRNALQSAQSLTPGSETEGNMPTLTKGELRSLYTGFVSNWSALSSSLTPTDDQVYLARRVSTSGTEKSAEVYWGFQNCNSTVSTIPGGSTDTTACSTGGTLTPVFEGSGSGNVLTCLNNHNAQGRYAIGILSMEFVPALPVTTGTATTTGVGWRWIKVEGVAPTLINAVNGTYDFVFEASCNVRPTYLGTRPANTALFVNTVCGPNAATPGQFSNADVIQAVNAGFVQSFGETGLLGLASNPANTVPSPPFTVAAVSDSPVWTFTRSGAGSPNSCQLPQAVAPIR